MARNGALVRSIESAESAVARALSLFRRIEELMGFGLGGLPGSVGKDDPDVTAAKVELLATIQDLAPRLLHARDALGHQMDFPGPIPTSETPKTGKRGDMLCASLLHFVGDLSERNSRGCVEALEELDAQLHSIQHDLDLRVGDSARPRAATPEPSREAAPEEVKVLLYRLQHGRKRHDAHVVVGEKAARWQLSERQLEDLRQLAQEQFALKSGDATRKRAERLRDRFRGLGIDARLSSDTGAHRLLLPVKLRIAEVNAVMDRKRDAQAILRDFDREAHGHRPL